MRQVRAKFRCMSTLKRWDGTTVVDLQPVIQKGKNPENAEFWKFTPSGDAVLTFRGPALDARGVEYSPGDYYYIDLSRSEFGGWVLSTITSHAKDNGQVELNTNGKQEPGSFSYGKLSMGIDNPPAFLAFDEPGVTWDVQFTWAEVSDD